MGNRTTRGKSTKKLIGVIVLTSLSFVTAFSQTFVKGVVKDQTDNKAVFATIFIKDTTIEKTMITDSTGGFVIPYAAIGTKKIIVSASGYLTDTVYLQSGSDSLITIFLKRSEKSLQDVVVSSQLPTIERKIDRFVLDVSKSPLVLGSNAYEVLGRTPLIHVSNESVSMIGKGQVQVMINGRLIRLAGADLVNYLSSISASNILRIEIITMPPSRYDASGNSGLINLVLKKPTGSGLGGSIYGVYHQTYYPSGEWGANITWNKKGLSIWGALYYKKGKTLPVENAITDYDQQSWSQQLFRRQLEERGTAQVNVDYEINKRNNLSFYYVGQLSGPAEYGAGMTSIISKTGNSMDSLFRTNNDISMNINAHNFSLQYKHVFDTLGQKNLTLQADYYDYSNDKAQKLRSENFYADGESTGISINDRSLAPQAIHIATAGVDYEQAIKKLKLNIGSKYTDISIDNDFRYLINGVTNDPTKSNHFKYQERVAAPYLTLNWEVKKFSFQAGIRGEYTSTLGRSVTSNTTNKKSYFNLFPTAYVLYKGNNPKNSLVLSYGRRIDRPKYSDLNPFRYYFNMYQYAEGNPFLLPAFTNNFELNYVCLGKYIFNFYYQHTSRVISQMPFVDGYSGLISYTRGNIGIQNGAGVNIIVPVKITGWWEASNTVSTFLRDQKIDFPGSELQFSKWAWSAVNNNIFKVHPKRNLTAELNIAYNSPAWSTIYRFDGYFTVNAGLRMTVIQNKLIAAVNLYDVFYSMNPEFKTLPNSLPYSIHYNNRNDTRKLRLVVVYNFGKSQNMKKAKTANEKERSRS
ncbi:MAG: outer membrane beta-barrel protein [Terrimonas ferruginea]|uniref:outer membrane beta-barrel family protein n=1 Tax=Terrimonas ferruginea TaxID=249 RepID=UPI0009275F28|nr:outer membrane beta-barrel family protein [Terrimonas ferruginea]MBN8782185.1 outer membrane beta-barrel protein [Terrimonas ferruginea]OJW42719.1 MAG: hypothetical protein BGO56_11760 [Sphingobacteriales bacterium 48-107]